MYKELFVIYKEKNSDKQKRMKRVIATDEAGTQILKRITANHVLVYAELIDESRKKELNLSEPKRVSANCC